MPVLETEKSWETKQNKRELTLTTCLLAPSTAYVLCVYFTVNPHFADEKTESQR